MSDIVERLRNHVNHRGGPTIENSAWQMMLEAAAEIEKLRAALKPFAAYVGQPANVYEYEGVRMSLVNQDVLMRLCKAAAEALKETNNGTV